MSRRHTGLRWHPSNAIALCFTCHAHYTQHPFEWVDFCNREFGWIVIDELRKESNKVTKWTKKQREDIHKHMLAQRGKEEIELHPLMVEI